MVAGNDQSWKNVSGLSLGVSSVGPRKRPGISEGTENSCRGLSKGSRAAGWERSDGFIDPGTQRNTRGRARGTRKSVQEECLIVLQTDVCLKVFVLLYASLYDPLRKGGPEDSFLGITRSPVSGKRPGVELVPPTSGDTLVLDLDPAILNLWRAVEHLKGSFRAHGLHEPPAGAIQGLEAYSYG